MKKWGKDVGLRGGRGCGQQKAAFWGEAALLLNIGLPAAGVFILWNLWVWTRWENLRV